MSSASGFQPVPGWYWPDDVPKESTTNSATESADTPTSSGEGWYWPDDVPKESTTNSATESADTPPSSGETPEAGEGTRSSRRRTHWPPRQCRICLETVLPTTHAPSENLPGFMQGIPNVTYEDENGRLIRPCLCKGSSKYVHEACLQQWRHADPSYGRRNYFQCPTCGFKYRLARLGWGRWLGSTATQLTMTITILFLVVFLLGFVADPIINMYLDPWGYLSGWDSSSYDYYYEEDESVTWYEHFLKGFAGMGVIGFLKTILASPIWIRLGGGARRGTTGRDRAEQIGWVIILIGVVTFLVAIYKGVRAWSRRTLEKAGERVMDVQQDDDDDDDEEEPETSASTD